MSTRSSIKWKEQTADGPGYHLYDDALDFAEDPPVYLHLSGVHVELETGEDGASLTVTIPRSIARELGLVPNAIELTGSPLAASPATGGSDVE